MAGGARRVSRRFPPVGGFPRNPLCFWLRAMIRRLIDRVVRTVPLPEEPEARAAKLLEFEWLVTNGIGGYSSSTAAGVITRRYHGILVAALPNPLGRMVMLNHLGEELRLDDRHAPLNSEKRVAGPVDPAAAAQIT